MSDPGFERLLQRIALMEREHPKAYRLRVMLLALLGHAYLGGVLATAILLMALAAIPVALSAFLLWPVIVALAAVAGLALRAAFARPPDPVGIPVDATTAPRLCELVEDVRVRLRAPRLARILVTPEINAAVVDLPGFLRRKPALLLGLPLLHAMPPEELRAVVAHELGHLARRHGRVLAWVWRVRHAWRSVGEEARRGGRGADPFRAFARWYVPRFSAWSFALARAQEREADRLAAELTSPRATADALTRVPLLQALAERDFWPAMRRRARQGGEELRPHDELADFVKRPLDDPALDRLLAAALSAEPHPGDAHPALGARLEELGVEPRVPPPPATTAAAELLGPCADAVARLLDSAWRAAGADAAKEESEAIEAESMAPLRERRRERSRLRRAELEALSSRRELEPSEAWEHAMAVGELDGAAAERELLSALVLRAPDHAPTCFELGRLLLQAGDASGAELLERAAALDDGLARLSGELLLAHAERAGDSQRAAEIGTRLEKAGSIEEAARGERAALPWSPACYRPADVGAELVKALRGVIAAVPGARRAILAERVVAILPQRKAWLLGLERDAAFDEPNRRDRDREIAEALLDAVDLGGHLTCLVASIEGRALLSRLAEIPGVVIWRSDGR